VVTVNTTCFHIKFSVFGLKECVYVLSTTPKETAIIPYTTLTDWFM